jgi:hypothetical protein
MLFDGDAQLPVATLRPSVHVRRTIFVDLGAWLAERRAWLRPRAVPLLAAMIGLFATLGTVKAVGLWSNGESLQLRVHAFQLDGAQYYPRPDESFRWRGPPILLLIQPLGPGEHRVALTLRTPDLQ